MDNKLISVIVPIYNVKDYLHKCINSIINQTYKNIEIILIDDGSTDNCGEICDQYQKKDNRIIVIHKSNGGLSNARNTGLDIAKGELISFVDSDDFIEPTMLEELYSNMIKYDSDISVCDFINVKNDKVKKHLFDKNEFVLKGKNKFIHLENKYEVLTIYAWNKLYKRELFNNIRYPNGKIFEDSYVICDLLDAAKKVSYIIKPLYNYVYRENSIINNFTIDHFNKIDSFNQKINFFNRKKYYDLKNDEINKKINILIYNLVNMKYYKIDNYEIISKYSNELLETSQSIPWKYACKRVKCYKIFKNIFLEYSYFKQLLKNKCKNIKFILHLYEKYISDFR